MCVRWQLMNSPGTVGRDLSSAPHKVHNCKCRESQTHESHLLRFQDLWRVASAVVGLVGESVTGLCRGGYLTRLNTTTNIQPQATRTNSIILSWTELSRSRICSRDGLPPTPPPLPLSTWLALHARSDAVDLIYCACNADPYLYLQFSKSV